MSGNFSALTWEQLRRNTGWIAPSGSVALYLEFICRFFDLLRQKISHSLLQLAPRQLYESL